MVSPLTPGSILLKMVWRKMFINCAFLCHKIGNNYDSALHAEHTMGDRENAPFICLFGLLYAIVAKRYVAGGNSNTNPVGVSSLLLPKLKQWRPVVGGKAVAGPRSHAFQHILQLSWLYYPVDQNIRFLTIQFWSFSDMKSLKLPFVFPCLKIKRHAKYKMSLLWKIWSLLGYSSR